nr:ribonuclease H-like domain-containing protein [Tanacetum cinerariifolium]
MAFLSSPGSTNEVDTANIQVSTVSTPVSTVSSHDNIANLSDATVYAFLANQPNGSQRVHEDLEQIHEDDLEEMDLKWQLALLIMRARRSPRNQESMPRNQDNSRRTVNVEDTSSKAMVTIDEAGFDCSYMADDEVLTNMALMAFSDPEGLMLLSPQHAGFGDLKLSYKIMSPKTVDHTFVRDLTMLIQKADSSQQWLGSPRETNPLMFDLKSGPQDALEDIGIIDSGCSRHMTGNKSYLTDFQEYDGEFIAFAGSSKGGKITGKSVSQICDQKNSVLFTKTECLILSLDFKLPDESQVLLKVPRKNSMYSFDLKNVVPLGLTCLFSKATNDEYNLWHMRLGHINFKTMNKLVKGNLVRGLPSKIFENDHTCVACQKGKQHKASCKFNGKADEGFLVGYSINSKAFRVYNSRTRKVEENLHVNFLENKPNIIGSGPEWLFDINSLTNSMNYQPVSTGNRTNGNAGLEINSDTGQAGEEKVPNQEYILLPLLNTSSNVPSSNEEDESSPKDDVGKKSSAKPTCVEGGKTDDLGSQNQQLKSTDGSENTKSTNSFNTTSPTVNVASNKNGTLHRTNDEWDFSTPITVNAAGFSFNHLDALDDFSKMTNLEDTGIFDDAYDDRDEGAEADYDNLETIIPFSPIPSTRIYKDHPKEQIIGEMELKKVTQALDDESWVEAMQEELLQFKLLNVEQQKDGIFPSQDKYVCDILKKVGFSSVKSASTPMETHKPLSKDADGTDTKIHIDNESAICVVKNLVYHSKTKHIKIRHQFIIDSYEKRLIEMVKIHTDYNVAYLFTKAFDVTRFQFLIASIGLKLKGYLINDGYVDLVQHADKKELAIPGKTTTGKEFSNLLMAGSLPKIISAKFWNTISSKTINFVKQIHAIVDGKAVVISESSVRSDLLFDDVDGMDTGGSPRRQETMGGHTSRSGEGRMEHTVELTDIVPSTPYDSPLTGGYTPRSDEGRLKLEELMDLCTTLSNRVTTLENELSSTKAAYHKAFITLTKRGRMIEELDKDEDVKLVSKKEEVQETTEPLKDDDDATLAETLLNIKKKLAQKLYAEELAKEAARQDQEKYNLEKPLELQRQLDKRENVSLGSESRPPMLNKENYVPWSSRLLRYTKSRPNGKLIHNSILNDPYVRRMIPEPGDANRDVNVTKTFHEQTDDELSEKELKQIEADDQAIQTILLGLPEDIYAAVDSCETAWLRVKQMMKGSDIRIQEKKAKLFNEWERFTSNEGESIESYYHHFLN